MAIHFENYKFQFSNVTEADSALDFYDDGDVFPEFINRKAEEIFGGEEFFKRHAIEYAMVNVVFRDQNGEVGEYECGPEWYLLPERIELHCKQGVEIMMLFPQHPFYNLPGRHEFIPEEVEKIQRLFEKILSLDETLVKEDFVFRSIEIRHVDQSYCRVKSFALGGGFITAEEAVDFINEHSAMV